MLKFEIVLVSSLNQNCCVCWCDETQQGVVIDPGEATAVADVVAKRNIDLKYILLTHNHFDHTKGADELGNRFQIPIVSSFRNDLVGESNEIRFGKQTMNVLHCPGHTPEHLVFVDHQAKWLFTGDTLFNGDVARSDFWNSDFSELIESIHRKLLPLTQYAFVPGHGSCSTIECQLSLNPFCK